MTEITASLVKELRERTGLGMMECKKALAEAGGNIDKAEELLRIKSGAKASKAAGRVAAEGIVAAYVSPDAKTGALVEVNCETDFVAKNEELIAFGAELAQAAVNDNVAEATALAGKFEAKRQALVQKIGENISVRRVERLAAKGKLARYLHGTKIGVLVDYEGTDEAGKDLALHVAFAKPQFMSRTDVPADVVERERAIQVARANESGKPAEIVAKMVEGSLNKFTGEISLLGQPFVKGDGKQTVEKMLASTKTKLHAYRFLVVGEGIEKKSSDFAAEVAAMAPKG
jgi:elongation factor Ts